MPDEVWDLLNKLCELNTRSQGIMLEVLVREAAAKAGIKPSKPTKK